MTTLVRRTIALALLALALPACGWERPDELVLDVQDENLVEFAEQAAHAWNACGAAVRVRLATDGTGVPLRYGGPFAGAHGYTVRRAWPSFDVGEPLAIEVERVLMYDDQQTIVSHEIGHALGLDHTAGGVMAKRPALEDTLPGPSDCAALRESE